MKVQNLTGTRDFYPDLQREINYIFSNWRKVAISFGYEEMEGPLIEPTDLWTLKSGDELSGQMYNFTDKGGRSVAVRPELTPTVARMVAQKQKELSKPIKWFSMGRFWRYERPQAGRLREFFQFNLDCLGVESMRADAEVIASAISIMEGFGLDERDFYVRLCNRRLIQDLLLQFVGKEKLQEVCRLIDKKDKLRKGDFELSLKDLGVERVEELVDFINENDLQNIDYQELTLEGKKGYTELVELVKYLKNYGYEKYVKVDFSIMRGLDYYTSTVFEIFDRTGEFRAVAGGGRYDDLVSIFGGEKCPGIGYGMGDVVLGLFLKAKGKMPKLEKDVEYFVVVIGEVYEDALRVVKRLRSEGKNVEIAVSDLNTQKQLNYAQKVNAKNLIFVGEEELKRGKFKVKNVYSGKESFWSF